MKDSKLKVAPITVGNPVAAASLAIDQLHLEEFASAEELSFNGSAQPRTMTMKKLLISAHCGR